MLPPCGVVPPQRKLFVSCDHVQRWLCDEAAIVGSRVSNVSFEAGHRLLQVAPQDAFGGHTAAETRQKAMAHLARDLTSVDAFGSGLRLPPQNDFLCADLLLCHQHVHEALQQLVLEGHFENLDEAHETLRLELQRAAANGGGVAPSVGGSAGGGSCCGGLVGRRQSSSSSVNDKLPSCDSSGSTSSVPAPLRPPASPTLFDEAPTSAATRATSPDDIPDHHRNLKFQSRGNWPLPFAIHARFADGYPALRSRLQKDTPAEGAPYVYEFGVADFDSQGHADVVLARLRHVCDGLSNACLRNNQPAMLALRERLDDHLAYWSPPPPSIPSLPKAPAGPPPLALPPTLTPRHASSAPNTFASAPGTLGGGGPLGTFPNPKRTRGLDPQVADFIFGPDRLFHDDVGPFPHMVPGRPPFSFHGGGPGVDPFLNPNVSTSPGLDASEPTTAINAPI